MNFECKKCANCCSNFLPLTDQEVKLLKKIKRKENVQVLNQNWYTICPFLNSNNRCDIYENRPSICRYYTCYKQDNFIFDTDLLNEKRKLVDIRKEIFNRK